MPPKSKRKHVLEWLHSVKYERKSTKYWHEASDFLSYFNETYPDVQISIPGYVQILNGIIKDGVFPPLRKKESRCTQRKRINFYLITTRKNDHLTTENICMPTAPTSKRKTCHQTANAHEDLIHMGQQAVHQLQNPDMSQDASYSPNKKTKRENIEDNPAIVTPDKESKYDQSRNHLPTTPVEMPMYHWPIQYSHCYPHNNLFHFGHYQHSILYVYPTLQSIPNKVFEDSWWNPPERSDNISITSDLDDDISVDELSTFELSDDELDKDTTTNTPVDTNKKADPYLYIKDQSDVATYIASAKCLDFVQSPRRNLFTASHDFVTIRPNNECDQFFKNYLITVAHELQFGEYSYKEQIIIAEAMIKRESYIAGYRKPVLSPTYFHQHVWTPFKREQRLNPSNAPYMFKSNRGMNRKSHVEKN